MENQIIMKSQNLFLLLLLILTLACTQQKEETLSQESEKIEQTVSENKSAIPMGDNSMTSLDWNGTYSGIVPCADCEGIETTLTLNIDRTFTIITNYLGRNDALEETFNGNFRWDETGSKVILEGVKFAPKQFKVGENRVWQLDKNGEIITGELADHYILTKKP